MTKGRRQDTASDSRDKDTIQKLKAMCRNQQKELARLKKELSRRLDVREDYKELLNTTEQATVNNEPQGKYCPKCNSETETVPIGKFLLIRCTSCDWRIRQESKK